MWAGQIWRKEGSLLRTVPTGEYNTRKMTTWKIDTKMASQSQKIRKLSETWDGLEVFIIGWRNLDINLLDDMVLKVDHGRKKTNNWIDL